MDFPIDPVPGTIIELGKYKWIATANGEWNLLPATLTPLDVPNLDASKITSGVFGVPRGAVGLTSLVAQSYLRAASTNTYELRTPAQVLSDIGALPTSSFTGTNILAALVPVSGAGSNLDADKLDGYDGTYYLNLANTNGTLNWNRIGNTPTTLAGYGITDGTPTNHTHTLASLTDVTISSIANGELLRWNGSGWINNTLAEAGIATASHTHADLASLTYVDTQIDAHFSSAGTTGVLDWDDNANCIAGVGPTLLTGSAANGPGGGTYYHPFTIRYGSTGNVTQFAIPYNGTVVHYRYRFSGTWSDWQTISTQVDLNLKANIAGQVFTGAISATNLSGTNTGDQTTITGNAGTATALQTARTINGVSFNGTANITVTAASPTALTFGNGFGNGSYNGGTATTLVLGTPSTLSGATTNAVTATSHTHALSANLSSWDAITPSAKLDAAATAVAATKLDTSRTINGVGFDGTANITITAAAPSSLSAGSGLTGTAYNGSAAQTFAIGTPGAVTLASTNAVQTTSHTHAFTPGGTTAQYIRGDGSLASFPSIPAGTVTGVTATSPVVSSGGSAPVISMPAATGTANGYLTSTDWTTFNNKQAALGFTPYNATNPDGYTSNAGTVTSVAAGNGMVFTTITGSGTVTLGTPTAVTLASTNAVSSTGHTHAFSPGGTIAQYIRGDGTLFNFPTVGNGLTLSTNNIVLGTPSEVTLASTNSVSATSHTHAFTPGGTTAQYIRGDGSLASFPSIPSGTVTSISVTTANGVSGSVANASTTPAITLTLGAITPTSVAATGAVTGSNLSGTNTGDQTTITGNAGTATTLQTARTINGVSFNGSANITVTAASPTALTFGNGFGNGSYNGSTATTLILGTPSTLSGATTNAVTTTSHTHALSSNLSLWDAIAPSAKLDVDATAAAATKLATARTINGVDFDGTANITITAASPNSLTPGDGLHGVSYSGSAPRSFALGTPSTLSGSTLNEVTSSSHTHELSANLSAWDGITPADKFDYTTAVEQGLYTPGAVPPTGGDMDTAFGTSNPRFGRLTSSSTNAPFAWGVFIQSPYSSAGGAILAMSTTTEGMAWKSHGGAWRTIYHSGNFANGTTAQYIRGDGSLATFPGGGGGSGTVTSVAAGNGMTFTTITGAGSVTMGTPGTLSGSTTNAVQTNSHTHALSANLSAWDGITTGSKLDFRSSIAPMAHTISNWNDAGDNGWYMASSATNAPTTGWFIGIVARHNDLFITQEVWAFSSAGSATSPRYRRQKVNGNWSAWTGDVNYDGQIAATGSTGGLGFADRGSGTLWQWYSNGDIASLWRPGGNLLSVDTTGNVTVTGVFVDPRGNVRKLPFNTQNANYTLATTDFNASVEKTNTSSYTYTLPNIGSQAQAITIVNSGTAGNITIARGTGVALYRNGVNANIVVGPGSMLTIYRSATAGRWIA